MPFAKERGIFSSIYASYFFKFLKKQHLKYGLLHSPSTNFIPLAEIFVCLFWEDNLNFLSIVCTSIINHIFMGASLLAQVFCDKRALSLKETPQNSARIMINQIGLSACYRFTDPGVINAYKGGTTPFQFPFQLYS